MPQGRANVQHLTGIQDNGWIIGYNASRHGEGVVLRNTRQRRAIREALEQAGALLDAQELQRISAKAVPAIGIATVYRAIRSMLDAGEIVAVTIPGQQVRYKIPGKHHPHHFHCRLCGGNFAVKACIGNPESIAPAGFKADDHELILYGFCDRCSRRSRAGLTR